MARYGPIGAVMGCVVVSLVRLVGFVVVVILVGALGLARCDECGTLGLVQLLGCCCFLGVGVAGRW